MKCGKPAANPPLAGELAGRSDGLRGFSRSPQSPTFPSIFKQMSKFRPNFPAFCNNSETFVVIIDSTPFQKPIPPEGGPAMNPIINRKARRQHRLRALCYGNPFSRRRPRAQSRRIFDISSVMPPAACRFVLQKRAHSGMKRARSCVIYIWKSGLSGFARIMGIRKSRPKAAHTIAE